ncbi:MAG: hypothetical protein AAF909_12270 [Pseudomonadota bacterium]
MLDALSPVQSQGDVTETTEGDVPAGSRPTRRDFGIGAWTPPAWPAPHAGLGAALPNTVGAIDPARMMGRQRMLAAAAAMAPFAAMQSASVAIRRARALQKGWREAASRCKSAQELIDVNRKYGEKALSAGAGEAWRVLERSLELGRVATNEK